MLITEARLFEYMAKLKEKLVCPNCGSTDIGKVEDTGELYCKSCGTVLEEEMAFA